MSNHYAVMGYPIQHSLSPQIHQLFAQQTGCQLVYTKIEIDVEKFEQQVRDFFTHGGKGLNITLPCKQRAFEMSQVATTRSQHAKAANTLWQVAGQLHADNTDGIGLMRDLQRYIDVRDKNILVLGAGGAVRGVLGPLLAAKPATLVLANRTIATALALQQEFMQVNRVCEWSALTAEFDVVLNATAASLSDESLAIPTDIFQAATLCYDLAYRLQEATPFVAQARALGCEAVDGLGMLVEQAAEAFYIWQGVMPDTAPVLSALKYSVR